MTDLQGFLLIQSGGADASGAENEGRYLRLFRGGSHEPPQKEFYFTLHDNVLSYAKAQGEPAIDIILMQNIHSVSPDGMQDVVISFKDTKKKPLVLHMANPADRNKWLTVLQRKTAAGSSTPNRKLSHRIVVDIDGDSSRTPEKTPKKKLSLNFGDDSPVPAKPAKAAEEPPSVKKDSSSSLKEKEDDDEDDDSVLVSCIAMGDKPPVSKNPFEDAKVASSGKEEPKQAPKSTSSNPFDDDKVQTKEAPKSVSTNPFDDDKAPQKQASKSVSTNPFDDDDDEIAPPPAIQSHRNNLFVDDDDDIIPPLVIPSSASKPETTEKEVLSSVSLDVTKDDSSKPAGETAASDKDTTHSESKEDAESVPADLTESFQLPDSIQDSFISAAMNDSSVNESFVLPEQEGGDGNESENGSMFFGSVSESTYGASVVIPSANADKKSLVQQFRRMQEDAKREKEGTSETGSGDQQPQVQEQYQEKEKKSDSAPEPKEKAPEWTLTKDSYVDVKTPADLRLLLKWGLPKGAVGICADGILIDFNPDKQPYWSLNSQGRMRIAMTKQETLDRLRERIVEAEKKGDKAVMDALIQRHKDIAASEEPEMTCFHFCDDLKLCYRQEEWVVMRKLPPAEDDPDEWINTLTARLTQFFASAQKSFLNFFDLGDRSLSTSSVEAPSSTLEAAEQKPLSKSEPPMSTTKNDPRGELLKNLEKDVNNLIRIVASGNSDEERSKLCNDATNPRIARMVRLFLCSDIAAIVGDGFKFERLFTSYHIWDWILSYANKKVVTASSITVLGMQNALGSVTALKYDKNASFRAFVCLGLSSGMLDTWFNLMLRDEEKMTKFFSPDAMLRNELFIDAVCGQLGRLSKVPFSLSMDFEARGMMSASPK